MSIYLKESGNNRLSGVATIVIMRRSLYMEEVKSNVVIGILHFDPIVLLVLSHIFL